MEKVALITKEFLIDMQDSLSLTFLMLFTFSIIFKNRLKIPFESFWNKVVMATWFFSFLFFRLLRYLDFTKNKNLLIFELIFLSLGIYVSKDLFRKEVFTKIIQIIIVFFLIKIIL